MIEGRAVVESIGRARDSLKHLGGKFKSDYAFKDIIFTPKSGKLDLNHDFLRVRVYSRNNWPTKDVVLVRKQTEFRKVGKVDNVALRKEFDTEKEAFGFIDKRLPGYIKDFEYGREGWEYQLQGHRVFIEDIKGFKPTVEIETNSEEELQEMFERIGVLEQVKDSVPEIMRRLYQIDDST